VSTDPDADRASIIVKVPDAQKDVYKTPYTLLPADEAWLLVFWYYLEHLKVFEDKFIAYSHVTTDALGRLARKNGVGYVKTWVGFAMLSAAVKAVWEGQFLTRDRNPGLVFDSFDMDAKRVWNIGASSKATASVLRRSADESARARPGRARQG